tara:strand:- start:224 stop:457 length:234 start_codon:yes stop_codon:yes gene_type:complete
MFEIIKEFITQYTVETVTVGIGLLIRGIERNRLIRKAKRVRRRLENQYELELNRKDKILNAKITGWVKKESTGLKKE